MNLSGVEITDALGEIKSAPPPAAGTVRAIANVLAFPSVTKLSPGEILARLDDMQLPQTILDQARPIFDKNGFAVGTAKIFYPPGRKTLKYTEATSGEIRLALLHVPPDLFDTPDIFGSFGLFIAKIGGVVRFVAQGRTDTSPGFNTYLTQQSEKSWYFVSWNWFLGFLAGTESIDQVFVLPEAVPSQSPGLSDLTDNDRKKIVAILAAQAAQPGGLTSKQTFETLILAAAWPDRFSTMMNWTNQPDADAQFLVKFAMNRERFASGEEKYGDTYLGALLCSVLPKLGLTDQKVLTELILQYRLVGRPDSLAAIGKGS